MQGIIDKLDSNPDYPIASKEETLLLKAFLNRSVTDLTLKVEEVRDDDEVDESVTSLTLRSLFDDAELLNEDVDCVINLDKCICVVTEAGRKRRDDLARLMRLRLEHFKMHTLQGVPQLVSHWTIAALEDNIVPIC